MSKAVTVKDIPANEFIPVLATHLKKKFADGKLELPEWTDRVKTAVFKELSPSDEDWYYTRAASLARKVYIKGGQGVGSFRVTYGGSQRRGAAPNRFRKASASIIRHILQQLKELDIVDTRTDKRGRWITKNGRHELDTIASQIANK